MNKSEIDSLAEAIYENFSSEHVNTQAGTIGNVVDAIDAAGVEIGRKIAGAITPLDAAPGHDAAGGTVASLTEAVMGVSAGLVEIAEAIRSLADAVVHPPEGKS